MIKIFLQLLWRLKCRKLNSLWEHVSYCIFLTSRPKQENLLQAKLLLKTWWGVRERKKIISIPGCEYKCNIGNHELFEVKLRLQTTWEREYFFLFKQILVQKCWFYFWSFQAVLCTWETLAFVQKENLLPRRVKCLKWVWFLMVNSFIGPNDFLLLIKRYTYILDSNISVTKITVLCQKHS